MKEQTELEIRPIPYNNGIPCYWKNEATGGLQTAVNAYFLPYQTIVVLPSIELAEKPLLYLRSYLFHWADAPCYKNNEYATEETRAKLEKLIQSAKHINSRKAIDDWIDQALDIGIDPF